MAYGTVNADTLVTSTSGGILGAGDASIMKNRIINGAMVIDQRNAGTSVSITASPQYTLDRWAATVSVASKITIQQNAGSVTPPAGFTNYLGVTSSSAYSISASDFFAINQPIEGYNVADLNFGSANAKTITFSFWVRSSLTGTFGGGILNSAQNRSYPFSYTISSANTWEQKTITVTGDTSGTWLTTNGNGMYVIFGLGVGSNFTGTAGAWVGTQAFSTTGATSVVGTSGATFYITGVQLEVGSSATGFEYVNYQTSLANCQRYYAKGLPSSAYGSMFWQGNTTTGNNYYTSVYLPVTMRTTPTATYTNVTTGGFNGTPVALDVSATVLMSGQLCNSTASASYYGMNYTASAEL